MNQKPIGSSNSSDRTFLSALNPFHSEEPTSDKPISAFGHSVNLGSSINQLARKASSSLGGAGSKIGDQVRKISHDSEINEKVSLAREKQSAHKARGEGELTKLYDRLIQAIRANNPYAESLFELLIEGEKNLLTLKQYPEDRQAKVELAVIQGKLSKCQEECYYAVKYNLANIADQNVEQFRSKMSSFELTPEEREEVHREVDDFSKHASKDVRSELMLQRQESHRAALGPKAQELYLKQQEAAKSHNRLAGEALKGLQEAQVLVEDRKAALSISNASKKNFSEQFVKEHELHHREEEVKLSILGRRLTLLKGILANKDPKEDTDDYALREIDKLFSKMPILSEHQMSEEERSAVGKSDQAYLSFLKEEGIISDEKKEG